MTEFLFSSLISVKNKHFLTVYKIGYSSNSGQVAAPHGWKFILLLCRVASERYQPPATTPCSQHKELCYEGNYGSGSMSPYKYHKKDNNAGMRYSIEMQTTYIKKKYQELGACQRKQTLQKHIFRFFHEHFIHPWHKILFLQTSFIS